MGRQKEQWLALANHEWRHENVLRFDDSQLLHAPGTSVYEIHQTDKLLLQIDSNYWNYFGLTF